MVKPFSPKSYLSISGKSSLGFIVVSIPGIAVLMTGLWSPSESKKKGSYQFSCNFIIDAIKKVKGKRAVTFCTRNDVIFSEENKCKGIYF